MLSFLREQGVEDSSEQEQVAAGKVTSDNAEATGEQEYLTVAAHSKNVRRTTILLAVLFGIGLLCLFFMIKKSTPKAALGAEAGAEETQIEKAIARLTGVRSEMFNRMDEIVRKFYEFSDVKQVQVEELVKNPFALEMFLANFRQMADAEETGIDAELMRLQTENMQLFSIMQLDHGSCCMIDDKILYEGDSIRGFKVRRIGDSFVELEAEGMEIILQLSE
jgi:preprotein translocase subunit SecG